MHSINIGENSTTEVGLPYKILTVFGISKMFLQNTLKQATTIRRIISFDSAVTS